jgi:hypothetical protein
LNTFTREVIIFAFMSLRCSNLNNSF